MDFHGVWRRRAQLADALAVEPRGSYTALIVRVLIVGAGIGGLTLGVALERAGHAVTIVEKRAHFQEEGAGVVLGPNVMTAVRLLDLTADIKAVGLERAAPVVESGTSARASPTA